ncbi:MAG: acyltransferase [Clostridia bacterium]|nr:acyltransferase [Clostridia bacterium]
MARRDADTNFIRIIACFFVVMIHCSYPATEVGRFLRAFSSFSVPIFVMISGHYMLDSKRSAKRLGGKIVKLGLILLGCSAAYFGLELLLELRSYENVGGLIEYLLTEPIHLWYLYAIGLLYALTPLLRVFHRNASRGEYRYALLLTFLLGSLLFVAMRAELSPTLAKIVDKMKVDYTCGYLFCYLFGGYYRKFGLQYRKTLVVVGVAALTVTAIGYTLYSGERAHLLTSYFFPGVLLGAVGLYSGLRLMLARFKPHWEMNTLANATFGIYLWHPALILLLQKMSTEPLSAWYAIPLRTVAVFSACALPMMLYVKLKKMSRRA